MDYMMKTAHRKSFGPVIFAVLVAGGLLPLLSACSGQPTKTWSESNVEKRNKVELTRLTHDVDFGPEARSLTDSAARSLDDFLVNSNVGLYDELSLDIPVGDKDQPSDIDLKRETALTAFLKSRGLKVATALTPYGAEPKPGTVRLVVSRYVVTPPPCPDWSKPAGADYQNQPSSNYGCATTSALGQMIANPHDLIEGRSYSGADGTVAAKAIQNYHENKVEDPTPSSTSSRAGASSGAGN
jgi:pilus assembly protein CpaD